MGVARDWQDLVQSTLVVSSALSPVCVVLMRTQRSSFVACTGLELELVLPQPPESGYAATTPTCLSYFLWC